MLLLKIEFAHFFFAVWSRDSTMAETRGLLACAIKLLNLHYTIVNNNCRSTIKLNLVLSYYLFVKELLAQGESSSLP